MNDKTLDYLMNRVEHRHRYKNGDDRGMHEKDYRTDRASDERYDRRGSHGNVDFEGSMDFRDSRDSRDYRESRDYRGRPPEPPRLSKSDIKRWDSMLENFDGSHGCRYDMEDIDKVVDKLGVRFRDFSEREFCITVNMMYADYGHVLKSKAASSDELLTLCAEMAKAFLDDPDGPYPSEKLALYFHCIVDSE